MSQDASAHFSFKRTEGVTVITVVDGQLVLENRDLLYDLANKLVDAPEPRRVVLNMSRVNAFQSLALGILIHFQKRVRQNGGSLKLCCLDPRILEALRLSRVQAVFEISKTEREAIDGFLG